MQRNHLRNGVVIGIILIVVGSGWMPTLYANGRTNISEETQLAALQTSRGRIYVGGTGPGNYSTIQAGITAAYPGDTVFVYAKIYYENVVINKAITLVGQGAASTIIDGSHSGVVVTMTASNARLEGFTVRNGGSYGIYLESVSKCIISHCVATGNTMFAIYLHNAADCVVEQTQSHHNFRYGMYLVLSPRCTILNCDVYENDNPSYHDHGIVVLASDGTSVLNCTSYNNYYGIYIDTSANCRVVNCTTYGNAGYGIHLMYKSNNTVVSNCRSYNNAGFGIYIEFTSYCTVENCVCYHTMVGVFLYNNALYNVVRNCSVSNNSWAGVYIRGLSSHNRVTECTSDYNYYGIQIFDRTTDNTVFHNNFFSNRNSAYAEGVNQWDDGYPSGGNYWDVYTGNDVFSGPDQNKPGADGIGDTPYLVSGYYQIDHYPLMNPWSSLPPAQYMIVDLGVLDGAEVSYAYGINDHGQVVGTSGEEIGLQTAVMWDAERLIDLGLLGGLWSEARGINDDGLIAGTACMHAVLWNSGGGVDLGALGGPDAVSYGYALNNLGHVVGTSYLEEQQWRPPHAFFWHDGVMNDLGTLHDDSYSIAYDINENDQVVGTSSHMIGDDTYAHAFLWDETSGMTALESLYGSNFSEAFALNTNGDIVGSAGNHGGSCAVLWQDGKPMDLGGLGGTKNIAYAINMKGSVVGSSCTTGNVALHAFVYDNGKLYDLNMLISTNSGWVLCEAYGINDAGQIVGYGINPAGQTHAFLLTPLLSLGSLRVTTE